MFVEKKKVIQIGSSTGITIKPNVEPFIKQGDEVMIEYHKNKIVIKKVQNEIRRWIYFKAIIL